MYIWCLLKCWKLLATPLSIQSMLKYTINTNSQMFFFFSLEISWWFHEFGFFLVFPVWPHVTSASPFLQQQSHTETKYFWSNTWHHLHIRKYYEKKPKWWDTEFIFQQMNNSQQQKSISISTVSPIFLFTSFFSRSWICLLTIRLQLFKGSGCFEKKRKTNSALPEMNTKKQNFKIQSLPVEFNLRSSINLLKHKANDSLKLQTLSFCLFFLVEFKWAFLITYWDSAWINTVNFYNFILNF